LLFSCLTGKLPMAVQSRLLILKVSVILWIQRKHVNWFLKQLPWAMEGGLHIRYG
jgi:hypothetical protein